MKRIAWGFLLGMAVAASFGATVMYTADSETYRSVTVPSTTPTGGGGLVMYNNFKALADRTWQIDDAGDPDADDDAANTGTNGIAREGTRWRNTTSGVLFQSVDDTTGAAVWEPTANAIGVTDTAAAGCYVGLFEAATGDLLPQTDGGLTYDASTGALTATGTGITIDGGTVDGLLTISSLQGSPGYNRSMVLFDRSNNSDWRIGTNGTDSWFRVESTSDGGSTWTAGFAFIVGDLDPSSSHPGIVIGRTIDRSSQGTNARSLLLQDNIDYASLAGKAHATVDITTQVTGAQDYDHFNGVQCRYAINTSGTTDFVHQYASQIEVNNGTVTESVNYYSRDWIGTGTVTTQHGWLMETLDNAGTNYAITIGNSDADQPILHMGVTGDPQLTWDESDDEFAWDNDVALAADNLELRFGAAATDFAIDFDGTAAQFTIASGDFVFNGGGVAIGVASTTYPLAIVDTGTTLGSFTTSNVGYGRVVIHAPADSDAQLAFVENSATKWQIGNDGSDGDSFKWMTKNAAFDGTEVMTLTAAGALDSITQLNCDNLRLDGNTLSSTDANGNINLTPNGTGGIAGIGATSSATGTVAFGTSCTASSNYSTVSGGQSNTASGAHSTVIGGLENTADEPYSQASGYGATVTETREDVFASGYFAVAGDAQVSRFVYRNTSVTDATTVNLDPTGAGSNRFNTVDETAYVVRVMFVARQDTGAWHACGQRQALFQMTGGTLAQIGATQTVGTDIATDANYTFILEDNTNNIRIRAATTSGGNINVRWVVYVEIATVAYAD